jgi:hypothetical protein
MVTRDAPRMHTYVVEAEGISVTVPAGEIDDCIRIHRSRVRAAGQAVMEGDEDLFWFCDGIGKVREEDMVSGQTEELVSCDVPAGKCP